MQPHLIVVILLVFFSKSIFFSLAGIYFCANGWIIHSITFTNLSIWVHPSLLYHYHVNHRDRCYCSVLISTQLNGKISIIDGKVSIVLKQIINSYIIVIITPNFWLKILQHACFVSALVFHLVQCEYIKRSLTILCVCMWVCVWVFLVIFVHCHW